MKISCTHCDKSYDLPDGRLPHGKMVSFPCPACKGKIKIDLRKPEKNTDDDRLVFKPLEDEAESNLDSKDLKKKIIKRIKDLPPMPKVLLKAREVMRNPRAGFKDIAQVIESDQAIAAKILKVANSAYYGMSGMVSSIHQASVVLGFKTLEQVITMVSSSSLLGSRLKGYGLNAGVLWKHSLAVALACRMIAEKRNPPLENDAFSVGLIHDAGKLALDRYILERAGEIRACLNNGSPSFLNAEKTVLGFDHTEIAEDLCKKWKLPDHHAEAMRYHHNPSAADDNELAYMVHLANHIAAVSDFGCGQGFNAEPLDETSLEVLRFKPEDVSDLSVNLVKAVEEITNSLS